MERLRRVVTNSNASRRVLCAIGVSLGLLARSAAADIAAWQPQPANISGVVMSVDREPVAGATVGIVRVDSRANWRGSGPWSHADCGKHAMSDAGGRFSLDGLDPAALFTVVVEAARFKPRHFLIDPRWRSPLEIKLVPPRYVRDDRYAWATGTVLLSDGKPAASAVIAVARSQAALRGGWTVGGGDPKPAVLTNDEGRFRIESDQQFLGQNPIISVAVYADGAVQHQTFDLPSGKDKELQLRDGADVTGRVLRNARPAPGVLVAAVEVAPIASELFTAQESLTDGEGHFTFHQLQPTTNYFIFTPMAPLASENLATVGREVRSGKSGDLTDAGELSLHPAYCVRGKLAFSRTPMRRPNIRAVLGRWSLPDFQETAVSDEGEFSFQGVPSEPVALTFHEPRVGFVEGYNLSTQNGNLDYLSLQELHGRVDENLDLRVLMEPGNVPAQRRALARVNPLSPEIRTGPQGSRRVVRKELEPLRGAPADRSN